MLIAELGKRIEQYSLINNLAQAQAAIDFGHIARGDIACAKNKLQRTPPCKMGIAVAKFLRKYKVQCVSMCRHLLVRVGVYFESTMALLGSDAIPNVMAHKLLKKLHLSMQSTNRSTNVANCASEKCVGKLNKFR